MLIFLKKSLKMALEWLYCYRSHCAFEFQSPYLDVFYILVLLGTNRINIFG